MELIFDWLVTSAYFWMSHGCDLDLSHGCDLDQSHARILHWGTTSSE